MTAKESSRRFDRPGAAARPAGEQVPTRPFSRRQAVVLAGLIAAAGLAAYHNSFQGEFLFDDVADITDNPHIRQLWPIWDAASAPPRTTAAGRPVLSLSLAVNYRISGLNVWSYHALNLTVHFLAGLALFGITRRTLCSGRLAKRFAAASPILALICTLIWLVHPLNTQAVTYVIQRAESLMAMFYLLTVYCAIRSLSSPSPGKGLWQAAAVVCCAAGMGAKEVMVTAPLMVVLYDRIFSFASFREALRRRWTLYAGLAATWVILAPLVAGDPRGSSAGFDLGAISPLGYAATQCGVILHYLRLSFWPDKLVLDYGWPIAATFAGFAASGAVLIALLAAVAAALLYRPALGFLGLWFFLILSPTSSFVPIIDPAFEHRMYLPLAAVVAATVIPVYYLGRSVLERLAVPGRHSRAAALVACVLAAAAITVLAMLTVRRNYDYRDEISIWTDTVAKRPVSPRAHCELGVAYIRAGLCQQAIASYSQAIKLNPNYALAYNNRGFAYLYTGDYDRAISDLDKSIARNPNYPVAYSNRAIAYGSKGDFDHALSDFTRALKLNPTSPDDYFHRGINYASKGDYDQAIRDYDMAIKLNPRHAAAHEAKVAALAAKGKSAEHQ